MSKQKVSNEKILNFRRQQEQYMRQHPAQRSKFLYAMEKMHARTAAAETDFRDQERFIDIENAEVDKDGFAIEEKYKVNRYGNETEESRFKYKPASQKKLHEAKRKLLNEEVEIDCFELTDLVENLPEDIDFQQWSFFAPFVLPLEPSEEVIEMLTKKDKEREKNAKG